MYVNQAHALCLHRLKEDVRVTGGREPSCECWDLNLGPLLSRLSSPALFFLIWRDPFMIVIPVILKPLR